MQAGRDLAPPPAQPPAAVAPGGASKVRAHASERIESWKPITDNRFSIAWRPMTRGGQSELWLGALPLELPHVEDPIRGHGQRTKHPGSLIARATAATSTKAPCHPGGHAPIEAGAGFERSRHVSS